jgi:hypothetical protein
MSRKLDSPLDRRVLEAARIMRLIDVQFADRPGAGGTCMLRSLIGSYVLFDLGIPADQHFGALLYRVGPDPHRDVLRFCASNNIGIYTTDGPCAFHSWLHADGYVIDFSVGDWPAMTRRSIDRPCPEDLQWTVDPAPAFWVKRAKKVIGEWRPDGVPDIGKVWYGPMVEPQGKGTIVTALHKQFEHLRDLIPAVVGKARTLGLPTTLVLDKKARQIYAPNQISLKEMLQTIAEARAPTVINRDRDRS